MRMGYVSKNAKKPKEKNPEGKKPKEKKPKEKKPKEKNDVDNKLKCYNNYLFS